MTEDDSQKALIYRGFSNQTNNLSCNEIAACRADPYVWGILGPAILLAGCVGNSFVIFVFFNPKMMRKKPVLSLTLGLLGVFDLMALLTGFLRHLLRKSFYGGIDVQSVTGADFICKGHEFLVYFSLTMSNWTLVVISFERFIIVWFRMKVNIILTVKFTVVVFMILATLSLAVHVHFFWSRGIIKGKNICDNIRNYHSFTERIMPTLDVIFSTTLPMGSVFILNILIFLKLYFHMRQRADLVHQATTSHTRLMESTTRMLLIVMVLFLLLVLPAKIYIAALPCKAPLYLCDQSTEAERRAYEAYRLLWTFVLLLQFCNHSINFYIYLATSSGFRKDLKMFCGCRCLEARVKDDSANHPEARRKSTQ